MFDNFDENEQEDDELFNDDNIEEALRKFRLLKQDAPSVFFSEEEIDNLSFHFYINAQHEDQMTIIEHGLYLYPNKVNFLVDKAALYSMRNEYQEALEIIQKAKSLEPYNALVLKTEAEILTDMDKTDEAEECFRQALGYSEFEDDDFIIDLYVNYAQLLSQNNNLERANKLIEKALKKFPTDEALFNQLAMNFISNGKYEPAIKYFKTKIDNDPYSHHAWYHLGRFYDLTGQQEMAMGAYEYAGLASEDAKNAFFSLAGIYETRGEYEQAIESYTKSFKHDGDTYPYICIARCYLALSDGDMARHYLKKAHSLEELLPEYNYLIGLSYLTDERPLTALPYFRKVFREDEEDFTALKGIFTCYLELENLSELRTLFFDQLEKNYDLLISNWKEMASVLYAAEMNDELNDFLNEVKTHKSYDDELDGVMICIRYDQYPTESNKENIISRLVLQMEDTIESVKLFCQDLYESHEFKQLVQYYKSSHEQ